MCKPADTKIVHSLSASSLASSSPPASAEEQEKFPIDRVLEPPSALARYTCVAILVGILSIWGKFAFIDEADIPNGRTEPIVQSGAVPLGLTLFYLVSLPLLRMFTNKFLSQVNVKLLLHETMIIYNAAQVLLNGWMVYRILDALLWRNHPFIAGPVYLVDTGATYAVYVHYCDKYLEFLDTYFMVLRGRMDQVSKSNSFSGDLARALEMNKISHYSTLFSTTGLLSAHLPPRLDWGCLVDRTQTVSRWRHLLWSAPQFLDPRDDVLLLHAQFAQNPLSLEEIPDNGAADTVLRRHYLLSLQYAPNARGRNMETVPGTQHSGL